MKHYFLSIILLLVHTQSTLAQLGQTISVNTKYILGPCGDTLILRGVNYAPYNWGWSPTQLHINQIALSGANAVRLVWYKNPTGATPISTYGNLTNLDSLLSKCIQAKLIPILDLHDETCQNNPANLITLANWYTQTAVKNLITKYKHSLIINISNESLFVMWTGNPGTAQSTYVSTYSTIINTLRSNGINVPLMIDAPDCGTNLDVLTAVGNTLQTNDPQHNLLFSAHAYWYSYAGNDSLQMLTKINNALAQNIPFLFGEIANLQDDVTMCQYTLNYQALLRICKAKKLGWLAWSWDNDGCASRQISTNGNFSSLTTYGNDIINNADYGLMVNTPIKSQYLLSGACNMNLKLFIQGYYTSNSQMRNVLYLQNAIPNPSSQTDTITIEFRRNISPYTIDYSKNTILNTNGTASCPIPLSIVGKNEYIVIKHRNAISTWSANPVIITNETRYDFSTAANKAYGNNQTLVSTLPNIYAFYSGDVNHDENIDLLDLSSVESSINNFQFGYFATDINGDGNIDLLDSPTVESNINQFIFSSYP